MDIVRSIRRAVAGVSPQWCAALTAALVLLAASPGQTGVAKQSHAPEAAGAVERIADRTLSVLRDATLDTRARQRRLEHLLRDSLDLAAIADFTLGYHRTRLSESQQASFRKAFGDYVVASYARRISRRAPESLAVIASRQVTPTTAAVSTRTEKAGGDDVVWTWRLLERDGRYRIVDMQMLGVSLAVTYRSKIGATLSNDGFEAVMAELRSHLEHGTAMQAEQLALFQLLGLKPNKIAEHIALSDK